MFRVIGGAVVYGLALYGVVRLFDRPKMEVVVHRGAKQGDERRSEASAGTVADGLTRAEASEVARPAATSPPFHSVIRKKP